jgi:hypothetical protein
LWSRTVKTGGNILESRPSGIGQILDFHLLINGFEPKTFVILPKQRALQLSHYLSLLKILFVGLCPMEGEETLINFGFNYELICW